MKHKNRSSLTVGVDVGGTRVKVGLVRGRRVLRQEELPTVKVARNPSRFVEWLGEVVAQFREEGLAPRGVGVGIPGLVRTPEGVVDRCANLPGWKNFPLQEQLGRRLRLKVVVDNDVHAITLAEWNYGAGRGAENLLCITLGTGVGGGLILGGKPYRSRKGPSAEIGHNPVAEEGPACSCGGRACLERFVGNQDILRQVRGRLKAGEGSHLRKLVKGDLLRLSPETIDEGCRRGDRLALETWRRAGERIGLVLVGAIHLLNPDRILIGGGIAKAGRWLFDPIRRTVRQRAMRGLREVKILPCRLGISAGILGSALLVEESEKDKR